ncbi:MAG: biopolymer transporter ExbD [Pirellulales bacterium]
MIRFPCPACGYLLQVRSSLAGRLGKCTNCNARLFVPDPSAAPPEPAPPPPKPPEESAAPVLPALVQSDMDELVDMTAMVDIVFFLLIFFLVTSLEGLQSAIKAPAPDPQKAAGQGKAAAPVTTAVEDDSSIVRIDRFDAIWVDGAECRGAQEVTIKLRELHDGPAPPSRLEVLCAGDATHGAAVTVLDAAQHVGFSDLHVALDHEE